MACGLNAEQRARQEDVGRGREQHALAWHRPLINSHAQCGQSTIPETLSGWVGRRVKVPGRRGRSPSSAAPRPEWKMSGLTGARTARGHFRPFPSSFGGSGGACSPDDSTAFASLDSTSPSSAKRIAKNFVVRVSDAASSVETSAGSPATRASLRSVRRRLRRRGRSPGDGRGGGEGGKRGQGVAEDLVVVSREVDGGAKLFLRGDRSAVEKRLAGLQVGGVLPFAVL